MSRPFKNKVQQAHARAAVSGRHWVASAAPATPKLRIGDQVIIRQTGKRDVIVRQEYSLWVLREHGGYYGDRDLQRADPSD